MSNVRRPPKAYSYTTGGGVCRYCQEPILVAGVQSKRHRWHPHCVQIWLIATQSEAARKAVRKRDKGVCAKCGFDCSKPGNHRPHHVGLSRWKTTRWRWTFVAGSDPDLGPYSDEPGVVLVEYSPIEWRMMRDWHADHIVPLWSVDRFAPDAMRYWGLENLQTLCDNCHAAKTAEEAGQRAKELRLRNKANGVETRRKRKIPSRPFPNVHRPLRG